MLEKAALVEQWEFLFWVNLQLDSPNCEEMVIEFEALNDRFSDYGDAGFIFH